MNATLSRTLANPEPTRRRVPFVVVLICAWAIPAVLVIIEEYSFNRMANRPSILWVIVLREGAQWATYAAFTPLILYLANRFQLSGRTRWRSIAVHLGAAIMIGVAAAGAATIGTLVSRGEIVSMARTPAPLIFLDWMLGDLPVAFLAYFAVVGVAHAMRYATEARRRSEDALRLEAQLADARLTALQGRLHPHFLFNTLNAITVLVRDGDIVRSTRMLELLGAMLRRVLDRSLPQVVTLRTELALLRQYLEIEEVRFSDRLTVVIAADDDTLDSGVPALVTQPLAENAIRHAVAHTSSAVTLTVRAAIIPGEDGSRVLEVRVEDDGPGLTPGWQQRSAERTGLSATASRLATLYGQSGTLDVRPGEGGGAVSVVRVPLASIAGG